MTHQQAKAVLPGADSKYLVINVLARRAKELARSKRPTIPYAEDHFEPVEVAREELIAGNLEILSRNEFTDELEKFEGVD